MPTPKAPVVIPLNLESFTPQEITWLAAKSAQSGKSTTEVAFEAISMAARRSKRATQGKARP